MRTSYVYIVVGKRGVLYIGVTNHLERRIVEHKTKAHQSFTAKHDCDRLVYFETFQHVREAIAREKQLTGW